MDNIGGADRIDLICLDWLLQRLSDRGLSSQVQNPIWFGSLQGSCYRLRVTDIEVGRRHDDFKLFS